MRSESSISKREKLKKDIQQIATAQRSPEAEARRQEQLKTATPGKALVSGSKEQEQLLRRNIAETQKSEQQARQEQIKEMGTEQEQALAKQQEVLAARGFGVTETEQAPTELAPVIEPVVTAEDEKNIAKDAFRLAMGKDKFTDEEGKEVDLRLGALPIGPGGAAKIATNAAKAATTGRIAKTLTKLRGFLKNKMVRNIGKYGTLGYTYFTERSLSNIDSALSQVRESITLPVQNALANPLVIDQSWEQIADFEDDIRTYERMVKTKENFTPSAIFGGRTLPIYQRIEKLDLAIATARNQLAKIEASGIIPSDEEAQLMMNEINRVLDDVGEPSKFLGLI